MNPQDQAMKNGQAGWAEKWTGSPSKSSKKSCHGINLDDHRKSFNMMNSASSAPTHVQDLDARFWKQS